MRRLVTFSFIMYAVCFYCVPIPLNLVWILVRRPGRSLSGLRSGLLLYAADHHYVVWFPPERLAAASSLSNFTRTLAGLSARR